MILAPVHEPDEQRTALSAAFANGQMTKEIGPFEIRFETPPRGRVQIAVRQVGATGRPLLYIRTHTGRGGVSAGLVAKSADGYYLLHDGRTHKKGLGQPFSENIVDIDGRSMYMIGRIDETIFTAIISFHSSRVEKTDDTTLSALAYDPGPSSPSMAVGHEKNLNAKHHSICSALFAYARSRGWIVLSRQTCSPDLAIARDGKKLLFEVKPDGSLPSIAAAIGQLLIYDEEIKATERFIVAPINYNIRIRCQNVLDANRIVWLPAADMPDDLSTEVKSVLD